MHIWVSLISLNHSFHSAHVLLKFILNNISYIIN